MHTLYFKTTMHVAQKQLLAAETKDTKDSLESDYPQVLFYKESTKIAITSLGASIDQLAETGISLSVPEGSLSSSDKPLNLYIHPCLSGPFQLPPEYEPASPAYLIQHSRKANFRKDVTIKIHHFTHLKSRKDCEDMAFFSASSTPQYTKGTNPVYTFKKIEANTRFSLVDQVGEISLRHFCFMQTGMKRSIEEDSEKNETKRKGIIYYYYYSLSLHITIATGHQRLYSANLYKYKQCRDDVSAIFCMSLYTPLHVKVYTVEPPIVDPLKRGQPLNKHFHLVHLLPLRRGQPLSTSHSDSTFVTSEKRTTSFHFP